MALFKRNSDDPGLQPPNPDEDAQRPIEAEELVLRSRPRSGHAEQFRRTWSAIEALNPDGAPRTIMVTSAVPGEGKSVAVLNLALAYCERPHSRVIVIDADMRRPSLEGYLGMARRQGCAEVLEGRIPLDQAIRRTSEPGLDVIGAGDAPENPTKIIRVDRLKSIMSGLKQRYDYVLIDGPPAHVLTEPHLIGASVDGIVLAVRLGTTPKQLVEETSQHLEAMGGNLLGVCLLGAEVRQQQYS